MRRRYHTMKKYVFFLLSIIWVVGLAGCGKQAMPKVDIDYGSSSIYTKEDMDSAIKLIQDEFSTWKGCELHSISYAGDDECNESNIAWMNELEKANDAKETFTQCIAFKSSFHSPINGGDAWNADEEYTNWGWFLARTDNGKWKLMTWGY